MKSGAGSSLIAALALTLVVMIWGATFTVVKGALQDASTLVFLALRFSLAAVLMPALILGRREAIRSLQRSWRGGVLAGLALFGGYFFQTMGLRYTSAPNSAFITSLSVVAVPLLGAVVYKSVPRPGEAAGVALAVGGLMLLTLKPEGSAMGRGDLLTVVCALCFGIHVLLLGRFAPKCGFEGLSVLQIGVTALISAGTFWWAEPVHLRWTPRLVFALVVTGVLATALAFTVQTWAQRHLSPVRTALILTMEPVFAWLTSYIVAGESLSGRGAAGALLILAGALMAELKPSRFAAHP